MLDSYAALLRRRMCAESFVGFSGCANEKRYAYDYVQLSSYLGCHYNPVYSLLSVFQ